MEVNTRIQVEHTITEELTGIDLVREQIRIAMGEKLSSSKKIEFKGHVIQCRINAENPAKNFAPSPGVLEYYSPGGLMSASIAPVIRAYHSSQLRLDDRQAALSRERSKRSDRVAQKGSKRVPHRRRQYDHSFSSIHV